MLNVQVLHIITRSRARVFPTTRHLACGGDVNNLRSSILY
jgi:hypothetical protein